MCSKSPHDGGQKLFQKDICDEDGANDCAVAEEKPHCFHDAFCLCRFHLPIMILVLLGKEEEGGEAEGNMSSYYIFIQSVKVCNITIYSDDAYNSSTRQASRQAHYSEL